MTTFERLQERYEHDNVFRTIVDVLENAIHQSYLTPFEVREAATFAAIRFEMRSTRSVLFRDGALESLSHLDNSSPYRKQESR